MSTTTDELRADTMYSNTIDTAYPAITPSGMAAAEILETLTAKITAATSAVGMQAEIGWLILAHEVTAREAVALLAVATRRASDAGRIAPSRVDRVYGRVERAATPYGIRFRW
ncbi:hypothetical protein [Rhodococcus sp. AQ5-07]|uniref:hypothetical protein n=1 Tax=Rhodococcus sp. AQ5-07 TaxID=2054902 RepID=UPI000DC045AA|nr:hypothetical protein [Rhodococcus sp. AQ5-07]RAL30959.1 hypothetical protein CVN56_30575 [Rhodococcus sp. AQ5-07]